MANIITVGLDPGSAYLLDRALEAGHHQISHKPKFTAADELNEADIVFVDSDGKQYLPLLKKVRGLSPNLPFVVVTRIPETSDWLDALEAGATDYCSTPFDARHMSWLMETALPVHRVVAA
jgi:DNA-binding NtrC family response regulator